MKIVMDLEPLDYWVPSNYCTMDLLCLNAGQVNLLAQLTSWNVASEEKASGFPSNAEVVRRIVDRSEGLYRQLVRRVIALPCCTRSLARLR